MTLKSLLALPFTAALLSTTTPAIAEQSGFYLVDILTLHDGKTAADADAYFELIEPIVAAHGMERALVQLEIAKVLRGDVSENLLNVWTVSDPETTMGAIFNDETYTQHIPLRNSIFDLENSTVMILNSGK